MLTIVSAKINQYFVQIQQLEVDLKLNCVFLFFGTLLI